MNKEKRIKFGIKKAKILYELKKYEDSKQFCEKTMEITSDFIYIIEMRLILAKNLLELNDIWNGYMNLLKLSAYTLEIKNKEDEKKITKRNSLNYSESEAEWKETEIDDLMREIEQTFLYFQMRIEKSKEMLHLAHYYYVLLKLKIYLNFFSGKFKFMI